MAQLPWQLEAERKKQELMAAVLAGPKVTEEKAAGAAGMGAEAGQPAQPPATDAAMAVDGQPE